MSTHRHTGFDRSWCPCDEPGVGKPLLETPEMEHQAVLERDPDALWNHLVAEHTDAARITGNSPNWHRTYVNAHRLAHYEAALNERDAIVNGRADGIVQCGDDEPHEHHAIHGAGEDDTAVFTCLGIRGVPQGDRREPHFVKENWFCVLCASGEHRRVVTGGKGS